jgi:hypothetical protein
MENNKAYLQKIHWVFLLGIAYSAAQFITPRFVDDRSSYWIEFFLETFLAISIEFAALGVITGKWKESLICSAIGLVPAALQVYFIFHESSPVILRIIQYIVAYSPLLVFMGLVYGWSKRLVPAFFLLMIAGTTDILVFFSVDSLLSFISWINMDRPYYYNDSRTLFNSLTAVFSVFGFVFKIIIICEIINYLHGKNYSGKATLINLGNIYTKGNCLLLFITFHILFFVLISGFSNYIENYISIALRSSAYGSFGSKSFQDYLKIMGAITIILGLSAIMFFAWYKRKFLLEAFISLGIRSKFLYWIIQFPFVGIIIFAILVALSNEKKDYIEKLESMGRFAGSSTGAVSGIALTVISLLVIDSIVRGLSVSTTAAIATLVLFIWMMASKTGYYAMLLINLFSILALLISPFFIKEWEGPSLFWLIPFTLINTVQLVLFFPVYHFEEFEYIPVEDPLPKSHENVHLFG